MCLFAISVSFLGKCLLAASTHFFDWIFWFFLVQSCMSCWYILVSNPLLVLPFANSTFHSANFFVDDFCTKAFMCNLVSFVCVFLNYCLFCLI